MKRGTGLLALLGIGAGALAFWQYKKMSPEKKEELKSKFTEGGRKIKEKLSGVEDNAMKSYQNTKATAKKEAQNFRREMDNVTS